MARSRNRRPIDPAKAACFQLRYLSRFRTQHLVAEVRCTLLHRSNIALSLDPSCLLPRKKCEWYSRRIELRPVLMTARNSSSAKTISEGTCRFKPVSGCVCFFRDHWVDAGATKFGTVDNDTMPPTSNAVNPWTAVLCSMPFDYRYRDRRCSVAAVAAATSRAKTASAMDATRKKCCRSCPSRQFPPTKADHIRGCLIDSACQFLRRLVLKAAACTNACTYRNKRHCSSSSMTRTIGLSSAATPSKPRARVDSSLVTYCLKLVGSTSQSWKCRCT
jgi:hypothetical protein